MLELLLAILCLNVKYEPVQPEDTILVLRQTSRKDSENLSQQYQELYEGFQEGLKRQDIGYPIRVVDIHDPDGMAQIRGQQFRYIVSMGTNASLIAKEQFQDTPSIYSMVLLPRYYGLDKLSNYPDKGVQGGIKALPSPQEQIAAIQRVHPNLTKIGILYPEAFKPFITDLRLAAAPTDLQIFAKPVSSKRELFPTFKALLDERIELFFIIPDTRLFSQFYQHIYLATMKKGIACIGPAEGFINHGAMWGLISSPFDIGIQTTKMLKEGLNSQKLSIEHPVANRLLLNKRVAERLKLQFPQNVLEEAKAQNRVIE